MSPNPQETSIFGQCKYVQSVVSFSNYAQVQFHYSDLADVSTDSKSNFVYLLPNSMNSDLLSEPKTFPLY